MSSYVYIQHSNLGHFVISTFPFHVASHSERHVVMYMFLYCANLHCRAQADNVELRHQRDQLQQELLQIQRALGAQ